MFLIIVQSCFSLCFLDIDVTLVFLMIVLSCFRLGVLAMDVNVSHDRAVMFSSLCSGY